MRSPPTEEWCVARGDFPSRSSLRERKNNNTMPLQTSTWKDRKRHKATVVQLAEWESQYQHHFDHFNQQYFASKLPTYRISLHDPLIVPGVPAEMSKYIAGYCDKKRRRIFLEAFPFPKAEGILLHEMAHVATNVHHGPRFRQEMSRLAAMDAPLGPINIATYVGG